MPHLNLQYSSNLKQSNFKPFFAKAHALLSKNLPTEISSCRSRAFCCDQYLVGTGDTNLNQAFVHLEVRIKPGRAEPILREVEAGLLDLLKQHLSAAFTNSKLVVSIEINEVSPYYSVFNNFD